MAEKFYDVLENNQHDYVYVHASIPQVFEGVYLDVCETMTDGSEKYASVRLSRPDARALATKLMELTE